MYLQYFGATLKKLRILCHESRNRTGKCADHSVLHVRFEDLTIWMIRGMTWVELVGYPTAIQAQHGTFPNNTCPLPTPETWLEFTAGIQFCKSSSTHSSAHFDHLWSTLQYSAISFPVFQASGYPHTTQGHLENIWGAAFNPSSQKSLKALSFRWKAMKRMMISSVKYTQKKFSPTMMAGWALNRIASCEDRTKNAHTTGKHGASRSPQLDGRITQQPRCWAATP